MDVRRPICDYFAIIGYDPASGLKQERIAEFGDNLSTDCGTPVRKSPLVATYEPKVIAHFPAERPNRPFTPEIASLALPQGIRLRTEKNVPREPSFHSFVVIREDGTRIYGCSLIFFEELSSIELRQQIFNAQLAYLREFASGGPSTSSPNDDLSPEGLLFEHRPEQEVEMAKNCGQHRSPYHQSIAQKYTTHSLPRKFAKTGGAYSAVNVGGAGADPADSWREEEHVAYYKNPKSPMFISKCLAIVTPIPIIYSSENLLHNLWALINEKCPLKEYSLEDLLHWMLHELYLPAPSTLAQLSFSGFHLLLRVPPPGEMPYFDYPIETLFAHISVDQFVKLLTSFMLEQQILLISRNARNLMLIAECLSVLVFPFCWQMPYCPILPHTQLKFLEAPIPWLMGICVGEQQLPKQQLYQCNICLLDVDSRQLEVPEDLPSFPRQHRIIGEINALLSRSAAAASSSQIDQKQEDGVHAFYLKGLQFNAVIRELFLDHFVSLFSTYEGYLLHAGTEHGGMVSVPKSRRKNGRMFRESTANFDKISFLVDQPESVLSFLSAFLETQMFTSPSRLYERLTRGTSLGGGDLRTIQPLPNTMAYDLKNIMRMTEIKTDIGFARAFVRLALERKLLYLYLKKLLFNTQLLQKMYKRNAFLRCDEEREQFLFHLLSLNANTLVASFCDLLERIWCHGLKKKQGKSALWNFIIAYHEWEKKSNKEANRRASSVTAAGGGGGGGDCPSGEDKVSSADESSPMLVDLISSIRRMASSSDASGDNGSEAGAAAAATAVATTDWSQSLLRAANVICERISGSAGSGGSTTGSVSGDERFSDARCDNYYNNNHKSATLPPRPPPPTGVHLSHRRPPAPPSAQRVHVPDEHKQQAEQQHMHRSRQTAEMDARRSRTPTPNSKKTAAIPAESVQKQPVPVEESDKTAAAEIVKSNSVVAAAYRKFIYKAPLKEMNNNNNNQRQVTNKQGRTARSSSSQRATPTQGRWTNLISDLASHLSEDSLSSRLALSSAVPASAGDNKGTPTRRRTRDLSSVPGQSVPLRVPRNRSLSRSSSPSRLYERLTRGTSLGGGDLRTIQPLPNTMAYDLKKMYKRNAFLRCDEEREQFLFHLLSLNAVDFNCFTNTFLTIKMRYEVLLVGSLDRFPASLLYIVMTGSHGCTSSIFLPANSVQFTFDFKNLGTLSTLRIGHSFGTDKANNNNTNLRLSKWFLDYVLVRNCVTAQTFYFRCGRWFGRGIDDGALERLLVAEAIVSRRHCASGSDDEEAANDGTPGGGTELSSSTACQQGMKLEQYLQRAESPMSAAAAFLSPRKAKMSADGAAAAGVVGTRQQRDRSHRRFRSPSCERKNSDLGTMQQSGIYASMDGGGADQLQVLEHRVGIAVNALTKHFLTSTDKDQQIRNAKLSTLLCSEDGGLLPSLDDIFTFGLAQRIFRPMYPWDYIEKVFVWFRKFFSSGESKKFTQEQRSLIIYTYNLVSKIAAHNAVGKEGKFHLFILFSLRDHILSGLLPLIAWVPVTGQLYEKSAFLRQPLKLSYLSKLISTLNDFQFLYEKSLLQGIEAI
uniref:UDENN domain-containing protein n=1 Tax=Globodera pallida TaxID=36090 RepID=A0A183BJX2_GLOPA